MKPIVTWIVVADGAHARMFESHGPGRPLTALEELRMTSDHRATHEILADKAPRTHESVGPTRHGIELKSDPHRELKRSFADHVADVLSQRLSQKAFERFVLVAPPKTLGDFRAAMSPPLRQALHAEVAKDLIKTPQIEIVSHLQDVVGV